MSCFSRDKKHCNDVLKSSFFSPVESKYWVHLMEGKWGPKIRSLPRIRGEDRLRPPASQTQLLPTGTRCLPLLGHARGPALDRGLGVGGGCMGTHILGCEGCPEDGKLKTASAGHCCSRVNASLCVGVNPASSAWLGWTGFDALHTLLGLPGPDPGIRLFSGNNGPFPPVASQQAGDTELPQSAFLDIQHMFLDIQLAPFFLTQIKHATRHLKNGRKFF